MIRLVVVSLVMFLAGGLTLSTLDWVERLTMTRRITVETTAREVVACLNISMLKPAMPGAQILCATATKDSGFIFRGFDLKDVREVRAR